MADPNRDKGVTLIELLVAISVFMIGLLALLGIFTQSGSVGQRAQYSYTAYNLAKNHLERLRAMDFALLAGAAEPDGVRVNAQGVPDAAGAFLRTTDVATAYHGRADLTRVMVSVQYTFRGVQNTSPVTASTVIFDSS